MNTRLSVLFLIILSLGSPRSFAQVTGKEDTSTDNTDYLEKILEKEINAAGSNSVYYTTATFKSTRIINGQSIENVGRGVLDFRISHRFGELNEGVQNLYGLDNATTKFGFDYGLTDWLMIGIGRSSFEKEYDGFFKAKILRQASNRRRPISISYVGGMSVQTMSVVNIPGYTYYLSNRLFYFNQLLLARKFNKSFSLQLMPSYLHYNLVTNAGEPNDVLAMGAGGRMKVSNRIAITGEYYYVIPGHKLDGYNNSVSVGIDIETGGHVFQLFLTNSSAVTERTFIGETTGDALKGHLHLGFNISRVFTVVKSREIVNIDKSW